ncbi:MAG: hypothetical protein AAB325_14550 [Pseudomonadota bacterium]
MSETPPQDRTERDARLTALYRAAAREEPPPALDDAIRAAARRAVSSRPQRVSSRFVRSWRVPLSIAAVMLLTVSLVTVMREEAPEVMLPPGGVRPLGEADHMQAGPVLDAGESATAVPKTVEPHAQRSDRVGLKPPARTGSSGIGFRDNRISPDPAAGSRKDRVAAEAVTRTPAPAPVPAAIPELAAGAAMREPSRARVAAAPAAQPSASPPASQIAGTILPRADLPPEKWLERIEQLRRQGKLEAARTSLAEFRKRYPDYELPASFKDWAGP